jgi:putative DNA primase/helicase
VRPKFRLIDQAIAPPPSLEQTLNDIGNARRFVDAFNGLLAYIPESGTWLEFDGRLWRGNGEGCALRAAQTVVQRLNEEAAAMADEKDRDLLLKFARQSGNLQKLRAMVAIAETTELVIPQARWNADPELFGVANGVLDLRTCELLDANPKDYVSKHSYVGFDPDARCPLWLKFIRRIMADNDDVRSFLRRAAGYCLLGHNHERTFFIPYGSGANGKSTFLHGLEHIMGDYGQATPVSTLLTHRSGNIPNDIARLAGARFVSAVETNKGGQLNAALVKRLTGNDRMSARFLHREFFDFYPSAKFWLATNSKPVIRETGNAI